MGGCLSTPSATNQALPARALSAQDDAEARRLARLEKELARAERRNLRLRAKVEAKDRADAAAAPPAPPQPRTWSNQTQESSRIPSLPSVRGADGF